MEKIFRGYWPILRAKKHLNEILPELPKLTYRKASILRDRIAKNVVDPPNKN